MFGLLALLQCGILNTWCTHLPKGADSRYSIRSILVIRGLESTCIERSSTFIVDLDSLKHPDDVKKDEFGKWSYSHMFVGEVRE